MSSFHYSVVKAINSYKRLLQRVTSTEEKNVRIRELGIRRQQLKEANDVDLYNVSKLIIADLEQRIGGGKSKFHGCYHGAELFLKHFKQLVSTCQIDNTSVIDIAQQTSRALVNALQLMNLPAQALDQHAVAEIVEFRNLVAKYGNAKQIRMFNGAVKKHQERNAHNADCATQMLPIEPM